MRDFELQGLKALRSVPLIRIKVTSSSGKDTSLAVSLKDTVAVVKDRALGGEFCKESSSYKLILADCHRALVDGKTLEEEGIREDDEFIILKSRQNACLGDQDKKRAAYKVPDIATIQQLTATIEPSKEKDTASASSSSHFNFNTELRRILVSLIDSSILLQSLDEEREDGNGKDKNEGPGNTVDPASLKQLTEMGFGEVRAKKALLSNRMSPLLAMEWLLQHETDTDIDEPVTPGVSHTKTRRKRREFTPNPRAVKNLKEMGFVEEEVLLALKASGNSQEAACEWLLGDRKGGIISTDEGLDTESPMYKAIMENPLVQLSLYNPRVLSAFEDMLDSPATSAIYINDPETGPVLLQISRIVQGFAR